MIQVNNYLTDWVDHRHYKVHYKPCQLFQDNEELFCKMFNFFYQTGSMGFMDIAKMAIVGTAGLEKNPWYTETVSESYFKQLTGIDIKEWRKMIHGEFPPEEKPPYRPGGVAHPPGHIPAKLPNFIKPEDGPRPIFPDLDEVIDAQNTD